MRRRDFLQSALVLAALSRAELASGATEFNYAALKRRARSDWAQGAIQLIELTAPNESG